MIVNDIECEFAIENGVPVLAYRGVRSKFAIGQNVTIDGVDYRVTGVAPSKFIPKVNKVSLV